MRNSKSEQEQLVAIASSEEVKALIEEKLKSLDSNALTPQGKILEYEIVLEDTKKNPMGGVIVYITINDDVRYGMTLFINKDENGELIRTGGSRTKELQELLEKGE